VDIDATRVAIDVLRHGGNAIDAAVAAAATLGVTEPFSSGLGGGGFLVFYDARTKTVHTIDGREAAPASMRENAFVDPATGLPLQFQEARISGISVGVPGTPQTWQTALRKWGTISLRDALRPAIKVADRGFVVDQTFQQQINENLAAFSQFSSSSALYLPGGAPPAVGSTFRNPDLARTYRLLSRQGMGAFYGGELAADIVRTVQHSPVVAAPRVPWPFAIRPGKLEASDLAGYEVRTPRPTHVRYRGFDVFGMPTPSSGGSTVGEGLNIVENWDLGDLSRTQALHRYLEASALAFADRNRYVGDNTPRALLDELLNQKFARERACLIDPAHALTKPVAPGVPDGSYDRCAVAPPALVLTDERGTTNLTVADRWGNVVEYTLTIEQIGGNAMVVPDRGFLLNNELTDFNFTPTQGSAHDPNLPGTGQAAAQLDGTDDPAQPRQAVPGHRFAGRLDHHHDRVPDPPQPDRPRHDTARGCRGRPGDPAQHDDGPGRACVPGVAGGGRVDGARPCVRAEPGDRGGDRRGVPARRTGRCGGGAGPPGRRFSGGRQAVAIGGRYVRRRSG